MLKVTACTTPARCAAASIRFASAMVSAIGFSTITCLPAASAASAIGAWRCVGVAMSITSISRSTINARQSPYDFSTKWASAFARAAFAELVAMAVTSAKPSRRIASR